MSRPDVGVLIAAGGRGSRAGGGHPKQFREIGGVPMLLRAIRPFARHPRVGAVAVALPAEFAEHPPEWLASVAGERLRLTAGGDTRAESVYAALQVLDPQCPVVLVHDAARPFVPLDTVDAVIALADSGIGAVPAVPVSDTIKRVEGEELRVAGTVDRSMLWRAQTPQGFPRSMLEAAFHSVARTAWPDFTDEAALVEAAGYPVRVTPDRTANLKVTTEEDFAVAEFLVSR